MNAIILLFYMNSIYNIIYVIFAFYLFIYYLLATNTVQCAQ